MARTRIAGGIVGALFGITLSWTGMTSPNVIRNALLFKDSYLFLFFASAVATAVIGQRLLRARHARALLTSEPIGWKVQAPQRRHIAGSVLFGLGWGIADACPGPVATQLGQGIGWSLFTMAGLITGVWLYLRAEERVVERARRPAGEAAPLASSA